MNQLCWLNASLLLHQPTKEPERGSSTQYELNWAHGPEYELCYLQPAVPVKFRRVLLVFQRLDDSIPTVVLEFCKQGSWSAPGFLCLWTTMDCTKICENSLQLSLHGHRFTDYGPVKICDECWSMCQCVPRTTPGWRRNEFTKDILLLDVRVAVLRWGRKVLGLPL